MTMDARLWAGLLLAGLLGAPAWAAGPPASPAPTAAANASARAATGAPALPLPAPAAEGPMAVEQALQRRRSVRAFAPRALTLAEVGQLLWAAQGRTSAEGGRTAPSAGATYPLDLLLAAGRVEGLTPGLYRYDPAAHGLVRLAADDRRAELAGATPGQAWIAQAPALLVLTALPARTARRYGERAERYVAIEVGHAAQNVYLQATARGLGTTLVGAFDDARVTEILALPAGQRPLALLPVGALR